MTIVAIANALHDGAMRARFHAEPIIQAAELLLQERMPRDVAVARPPPEQVAAATQIASLDTGDPAPLQLAAFARAAHASAVERPLLGDGDGGRLRLQPLARHRGHALARGRHLRWLGRLYLPARCAQRRDLVGRLSAQRRRTGQLRSRLSPRIAPRSSARDGTLTTTLEVAVSPEDDAEVRRVSITNHGSRTREIEVTSYAEIVLARQADDVAHPAFAKMFVETEFVPNLGAILATRRQRSSGDPQVWAAHLAVVEGERSGDVQFETDRARFLGRGQTIRTPSAIADGWPLSNTAGAVLDPIFSLRRRVQDSARRHGARRVLDHGRRHARRGARSGRQASRRDRVRARNDARLDAGADAAAPSWHRHGRGASVSAPRQSRALFRSDPAAAARGPQARARARLSTLWAQGISGDLPIVLVRIDENDDLELVRQLLRAHEYWRLKQLAVDLVILNERAVVLCPGFADRARQRWSA